MTVRYKILEYDNLKLQPLDFMSLLYDKRSGITHIISDPAPQIIETLGNQSMSSLQIEQSLKNQYDLKADEQEEASFEAIITARLEEFVDLGFVVRVQPPIESRDIVHV